MPLVTPRRSRTWSARASLLVLLASASIARGQAPPDAGVGATVDAAVAPPTLDAGSPDGGDGEAASASDGGLAEGGATGDAEADAGTSDAAPPAPVDPNALTPPELIAFVPAAYPPEAHAQKLEGAVVLVVEVGEDGFVRDAEVREPAGNGFDEAARAAVLRFAFEPATRGGQPIAARILYRYEFRWQPDPAVNAPTRGELEVTLRGGDADAPLAEAEVSIAPADGDPAQATRVRTDVDGRAELLDLPEGTYQVVASAEGYEAQVVEEQVVAGERTSVILRLGVEDPIAGYGAEARVEAPAREVTRRTIEKEVLTRVAGTRGDALRTIELLPGVARPPFTAGIVIIRGAAPGDSSIQLDGTQVPLLYHFGGLTSFFNSRALERIDFYPGNFSARYGRAIGGIVDIEVRDPSTTGYHGVLDVNLPLDSSLLVEGPITEKASFMLAGRRSYFGEVMRAVIPEGTLETFAAPVYYDAQGIVTYRPTPKDRIRFVSYASGDGLELLFSDVPADDPQLRGFEFNVNFQRVQAEWLHRYSDDFTQDVRVSYGHSPTQFDLGPEYYFNLRVNDVTIRGEWRYRVSPEVTLTVGTDSVMGRYTIDYRGPQPTQAEGNAGDMGPLSTLPILQLDGFADPIAQPSLYAESDLRPFEDWQFVLGLRMDYDNAIQEAWFDPRLTALYQVTEELKLKGGVGVYSQPPRVEESAAVIGGNPNLVPTRAMHYGVGAEYKFAEVFSLGVDGFFKNLYDTVVSAPGGQPGPNFINDGIGRIYGMELSGRAQGGEKFFGFFSYTLMKSERNDRGEGWRPFDYDQRHILTVSGNYNFGNGWELGGTYRVVTGNPMTPVDSAAFDADSNVYQASYGPTNSERAPTFHRLDVRAQRTWTFDRWSLAAYLDIQNVYNAKNPEGDAYNFDYTEVEQVRGLPIIPILGLKGEM